MRFLLVSGVIYLGTRFTREGITGPTILNLSRVVCLGGERGGGLAICNMSCHCNGVVPIILLSDARKVIAE